nr:1-(5-phosphoribosyl)-5-[(5-phosphoribosylamino)methylideneamino]imidazole-4-carboxamide isomerase [Acetobacter garciniae]
MPSATPPARPLTLYPAIDLKDGACVRLRRGEMDDATIYSDNPGAQASAWQAAGFRWLHVVDLNGAFAGSSVNAPAVRAIIEATNLPVQLGGGLRDMKAIETWLSTGITRVILGSVAVKNPELVREACKAFPGRIVAGIDARAGRVATEGWAEVSDMEATELALRMQDAGVAAIIFTEISRDGMLEGLDIEQTVALARAVQVPVIASGGVGTIAHLAALHEAARTAPGIEGVIVGRALYDGRVSPAEALRVLSAC